jgi:hypothetical protein
MKQVSWEEAEKIAGEAAFKAIGFGPTTGKVTVDAEEVIRVATSAAVLAMRACGNLDESDAKSKAWNDRRAEEADRVHEAWKRAQRKKG